MLPSFPAALPTKSQCEGNATHVLLNLSKVRPTGLSVVPPPSEIREQSYSLSSPQHRHPSCSTYVHYILDIPCNFQYLRLWSFGDNKITELQVKLQQNFLTSSSGFCLWRLRYHGARRFVWLADHITIVTHVTPHPFPLQHWQQQQQIIIIE